MKKTAMMLTLLATTSVAAQTPARASTWWFLMNDASQSTIISPSTSVNSSAKVMGPYTSSEVCRLVARQQLPNDRRFWTAEERRVAEIADQVARQQRMTARQADIANRQSAIKAFHQLYPQGGVLLYKGERIRILADGSEYFPLTDISTDFGEAQGDAALSGCVEVKPE